MLLSKIELLIHSNMYLQKSILFKHISNQQHILVGCKLKFNKSLNTSDFEMDG